MKYFDNVVDYNDKAFIYEFCQNSNFKLGWYDSEEYNKLSTPSLFSHWSLEDLKNSKLYSHIQKIQDLSRFERAILNLTKPGDVHYIHTHNQHDVILYYVNLEWKDGWYGETVFYDKDAKEITDTVTYTPGRVVLFDGKQPHAIRPQSIIGPQIRFTISIFLKK